MRSIACQNDRWSFFLLKHSIIFSLAFVSIKCFFFRIWTHFTLNSVHICALNTLKSMNRAWCWQRADFRVNFFGWRFFSGWMKLSHCPEKNKNQNPKLHTERLRIGQNSVYWWASRYYITCQPKFGNRCFSTQRCQKTDDQWTNGNKSRERATTARVHFINLQSRCDERVSKNTIDIPKNHFQTSK